ncbi:MAG: hypothetical protein LC118_21775 [Dehalococcoidia bacterium]|nr:hypothetical protein [Dehalococcoidia bacterium]
MNLFVWFETPTFTDIGSDGPASVGVGVGGAGVGVAGTGVGVAGAGVAIVVTVLAVDAVGDGMVVGLGAVAVVATGVVLASTVVALLTGEEPAPGLVVAVATEVTVGVAVGAASLPPPQPATSIPASTTARGTPHIIFVLIISLLDSPVVASVQSWCERPFARDARSFVSGCTPSPGCPAGW